MHKFLILFFQLKNEPQGGNFIDDIKKVMNGVYRNLQPQFENDNKYLGSQIKAVIGTTIRVSVLA